MEVQRYFSGGNEHDYIRISDIFCTNVLGMNSALVGTLLMVSKLFDGFTDLLAGFLIDNTKSKWGKARPYEIAVIGVWGCSVLLFLHHRSGVQP